MRQGLRLGYPLCCIAHFCWDGIWGWPSGMVRWRQIRAHATRPQGFVPCGLLHVGCSSLSLPQRLRGIGRFYRRHLRVTRARPRPSPVALYGSQRWRDSSVDELIRRSAARDAYYRLYWGLDD